MRGSHCFENNERKQFTTRCGPTVSFKGRLTGIQFLELFTDNLYFNISRHAIEMANKMKDGFKNKGYRLYFDTPTNQQFYLSNEKMAELEQKVKFAVGKNTMINIVLLDSQPVGRQLRRILINIELI